MANKVPEYIKTLIEEARQKDIAISLPSLIRAAAINKVGIDQAIRDMRTAINDKNFDDTTTVGHDILMFTHQNQVAQVFDEAKKAKFQADVERALVNARTLYEHETGKQLTPEQENKLREEVTAEKKNDPTMTPYGNPYDLKAKPSPFNT